MLLLTYDPNVKQTPDYRVSLVSPYGSSARIQQQNREILYKIFLALWLSFPRAEVQNEP
jgi:hypothetical protein